MEFERLNLKKAGKDKSTEATRLDNEWIGNGRYGEVERATLEVDGEINEKNVTLALKRYFDRPDVDEEFIENIQRNYEKLRSLKLPVLNTFRIDTEKMLVATTDWTEGKKFDVGGYGNVHEAEGTEKIASITNIREVADSIFSAAIIAGNNLSEIAGDAYYFRYPRSGGDVELEFVIGDIDGVIDPPLLVHRIPTN